MNEMYSQVNRAKMALESEISQQIDSFVFDSKIFKSQDSNGIVGMDYYNQKMNQLQTSAHSISQKLENLHDSISRMHALLDNSNLTIDSKSIWKKKIANLESTARSLQKGFERSYNTKIDNMRFEKQQTDLFGLSNRNKETSNDGVKILIEDKESLSRSENKASEIISQGHGILRSLGNQEEILKNVQKRTKTLMNDLGLANMYMRLIQRRSTNDLYLMVFLFVLLFVLIIVLKYYVRPYVRGQ